MPATATRRELILGAASAVALAPASAAAAGPDLYAGASARLTLSPGPFVAAALAELVAAGRLGLHDPIAPHLDGTEAFRPDGTMLTVADLDAAAHDVDRFLATQLIERLTGQPLADHLAQALLRPLGMRDTRLLGSPCLSAVECSDEDERRWRRWELAASTDGSRRLVVA